MDLVNNPIEAGRLVIVYFWPNTEYQIQGVIHMPAEVLLTTAPNTPDNEPGNPLEYCNLSPPPPRDVKPPEALARKTVPSESSDETYIEEVSQTSSDKLIRSYRRSNT